MFVLTAVGIHMGISLSPIPDGWDRFKQISHLSFCIHVVNVLHLLGDIYAFCFNFRLDQYFWRCLRTDVSGEMLRVNLLGWFGQCVLGSLGYSPTEGLSTGLSLRLSPKQWRERFQHVLDFRGHSFVSCVSYMENQADDTFFFLMC